LSVCDIVEQQSTLSTPARTEMSGESEAAGSLCGTDNTLNQWNDISLDLLYPKYLLLRGEKTISCFRGRTFDYCVIYDDRFSPKLNSNCWDLTRCYFSFEKLLKK
jgi:hypothetical protein